MTLLNHALRAGRSSPGASAAAPTVLVAGGGGTLGSAVLEALLGGRRFAHVKVLATRGLTTAMRGLEPVIVDGLDGLDGTAAEAHGAALAGIADIAVLVFDRERHANGRELAFVRPQPHDLPMLARWLYVRGTRRLIVVLPHAPATLPAALRHGLANLDEQAVAALGFEHLVFVRSAQKQAGTRATRWPERLADGVLAQLGMMVAAPQQPVRAVKVARFVVELVVALPSSGAGTRVAPPELVWQAAQMQDPRALVEAWLAHRALPEVTTPRRRM